MTITESTEHEHTCQLQKTQHSVTMTLTTLIHNKLIQRYLLPYTCQISG